MRHIFALALIALCLAAGCQRREAEARNKNDTIEELAARRARAQINGAEPSDDESGAVELR